MSKETNPSNAGKAWTTEELLLIASYVPTKRNAFYLAEVLGRTAHAVQYMWCKLYWPATKLKELAKDDSYSNHYNKILEVRRKIGIYI